MLALTADRRQVGGIDNSVKEDVRTIVGMVVFLFVSACTLPLVATCFAEIQGLSIARIG